MGLNVLRLLKKIFERQNNFISPLKQFQNTACGRLSDKITEKEARAQRSSYLAGNRCHLIGLFPRPDRDLRM